MKNNNSSEIKDHITIPISFEVNLPKEKVTKDFIEKACNFVYQTALSRILKKYE